MKWKENLAMKALAFMAAVAAFTATAILGWYQIANFDILWGDSAPWNGYTVRYLEREDSIGIDYLLALYNQEALGQELSISAKQDKLNLEDEFDTDVTNLRWQALDSQGNVRYGNTQADIPARVQGLYQKRYTWTTATATITVFSDYTDWFSAAEDAVNAADTDNVVYVGDMLSELDEAVQAYRTGSQTEENALDTVYLNTEGQTDVLVVEDAAGVHVYGPSIRAATTINEYGYHFVGGEWVQAKDMSGEQTETLTITLWLDSSLPVNDDYQRAIYTLRNWQANRELHLAVTILCAAAGLTLSIFLCVVCGHKRGVNGIYLNWFHRIPSDLLLCLLLAGGFVTLAMGFDTDFFYYYYNNVNLGWPMAWQLTLVGLIVSSCAAMGLAALITFVARCKAHTLLRNTLTWRICRWLWRLCLGLWRSFMAAISALPLIWKAIVVGMLYIFFTILTFRGNAGLWLLVTLALLAYLCLWAYQWRRIRQGTREIVGGNTDYHIDTYRMLPDLRSHADELNNLSHSISAAVEDRMRSEHFKAELITNVSHDLKTPLTSIINYVDLLKKEQIDNPKAAEYIEVLDRKSQRLKKLTEDLVEASKASTGNLTVTRERLDLGQLLDQAIAEYLERLESQRLTVVRTLPETPVWVEADGRHLWRVIDNLLSNCAKYALEGTRVYVSVQQFADCAVLSIKNISRDALNVPAELLVERFVRGDESRTAEGSGLGLSIAQSLTELQNGRFEISIDGDLFKATVTLPLMEDAPVSPVFPDSVM